MVKEGDIGLLKIKHRNEKLGGSKSNKGFYSSLYDRFCETRVIWASYLVVYFAHFQLELCREYFNSTLYWQPISDFQIFSHISSMSII